VCFRAGSRASRDMGISHITKSNRGKLLGYIKYQFRTSRSRLKYSSHLRLRIRLWDPSSRINKGILYYYLLLIVRYILRK
jgi:hypothetical protein